MAITNQNGLKLFLAEKSAIAAANRAAAALPSYAKAKDAMSAYAGDDENGRSLYRGELWLHYCSRRDYPRMLALAGRIEAKHGIRVYLGTLYRTEEAARAALREIVATLPAHLARCYKPEPKREVSLCKAQREPQGRYVLSVTFHPLSDQAWRDLAVWRREQGISTAVMSTKRFRL